MADRFYVGDYGPRITVDVNRDISAALSSVIEVTKPNGSVVTWNATVSQASNLIYTIADGDLDEVGEYRCQALVTFAAGKFHGDTFKFEVDALASSDQPGTTDVTPASITKTFDMTSSAGFTFDSALVEFAGGVVKTKADTKISLLLHFDGSGAPIDSSTYAHSVSKFGTGAQSAVQSKFGGKSWFQNNSTGNYVSVPNHTTLNLAAADFTIHFWHWTSLPSGSGHIINKRIDSATANEFLLVKSSSQYRMYVSNDGLQPFVVDQSWGTIASSTWQHVAVTRQSGIFRFYTDGVLNATVSNFAGSIFVGTGIMTLFARAFSNDFNMQGYIDEMTIIKGLAMWTGSSFSVPTSETKLYPTSTDVTFPDIAPPTIGSALSFTETLGGSNAGSVKYQLSDDSCVTWKYWDGAAWVAAGAADYNTAADIDANIDTFATDPFGTICIKSFLLGNGSQLVELDQIDLDYTGDWPAFSKNSYIF